MKLSHFSSFLKLCQTSLYLYILSMVQLKKKDALHNKLKLSSSHDVSSTLLFLLGDQIRNMLCQFFKNGNLSYSQQSIARINNEWKPLTKQPKQVTTCDTCHSLYLKLPPPKSLDTPTYLSLFFLAFFLSSLSRSSSCINPMSSLALCLTEKKQWHFAMNGTYHCSASHLLCCSMINRKLGNYTTPLNTHSR